MYNESLGHNQAIFTVQVNVSKLVANATREPILKTGGGRLPAHLERPQPTLRTDDEMPPIIDIFVHGDGGFPCWRVPAVVLAIWPTLGSSAAADT
jgi:hypothetical protein